MTRRSGPIRANGGGPDHGPADKKKEPSGRKTQDKAKKTKPPAKPKG